VWWFGVLTKYYHTFFLLAKFYQIKKENDSFCHLYSDTKLKNYCTICHEFFNPKAKIKIHLVHIKPIQKPIQKLFPNQKDSHFP
jgi:hypothetical protein